MVLRLLLLRTGHDYCPSILVKPIKGRVPGQYKMRWSPMGRDIVQFQTLSPDLFSSGDDAAQVRKNSAKSAYL